MPMQMDEPEVGSEAALSDGGMELQCGQKVELPASSLRHEMLPTAEVMLRCHLLLTSV